MTAVAKDPGYKFSVHRYRSYSLEYPLRLNKYKMHKTSANVYHTFLQGHFIRRIAIRFIDIVAGLAVQCWGDGHIVAVDSVTPTIFVLAEDGRLIKYHECSEFMNEPSDIAVFGRDYYICDFKGNMPGLHYWNELTLMIEYHKCWLFVVH